MQNGVVEVLDDVGDVIAHGTVVVTTPARQSGPYLMLAWEAVLTLRVVLPAGRAIRPGTNITLRWANGAIEMCGVSSLEQRAQTGARVTLAPPLIR